MMQGGRDAERIAVEELIPGFTVDRLICNVLNLTWQRCMGAAETPRSSAT
jgi:hypothetical protein